MRSGATRVPIPNTRVKAGTADGTALETVWESRRLPDQKKEEKESVQERKHVGRRGLSSAGRAPALQAGGREFESLSLHGILKKIHCRTLKTEY